MSYNKLTPELREWKKQARQQFGSWRAFILGYLIFTVFEFFGVLFSVTSSRVLYGIPEYLGFAALLTLIAHISMRTAGNRNSIEDYDAQATNIVLISGLCLILLQLVLGYLNAYWFSGTPQGSSMDLILALTLKDETAGLMRHCFPTYQASWQSKGRFARLGIALLSFTALLPLAAGWGIAFVVAAVLPASIFGILQAAAAAAAFWVLYLLIRAFTQGDDPSRLRLLVALVIFILGVFNGLVSGSPEITDDLMTTLTSVLLYALLGIEILAVLTLWYLFVLIPKYTSAQKA